MMSKIKDWLIHRLGGHTTADVLNHPIQIVRQELPTSLFRVVRIAHDIDPRSVVDQYIKNELITQLMEASPCPIKITRTRSGDYTETCVAEIRVCVPEDYE